jgi:hypothetical protein
MSTIPRDLLLIAACGLLLLGGDRGLGAQAPTATPGQLRIVVLEGEGAVNVIQRKTAVAPLVEVRDRNNLPVVGATVTFTVNGGSATFGGGLQTLTVTTNAAGRAAIAGLTPLQSGAVQINLQAAFQGQTAVATITQTNVLTAAQATTASAGAAGGGGGISNTAVVGVVGGAGAAAAAVALAVAASDAEESNIIVNPPGRGIRDVTEFAFTMPGAAGEVTWDFGDGGTATGPSSVHIFRSEGTFQVVSRSATGTATGSITIGTLNGTWRQGTTASSSYEEVVITQQGGQLVGQWSHTCTGLPSAPGVNPCGVTEVSSLSGNVISPRTVTFSHTGGCQFLFRNGTVSEDLRSMNGTMEIRNPGCVTGPITPTAAATFTKQ